MFTTHATGSATITPIAFCSFVAGFIIDDLKKMIKFSICSQVVIYLTEAILLGPNRQHVMVRPF